MEQFKSTTNNLTYILTLSLITMTFVTLVYYPDSLFKDVFTIFAPIVTGVWGYKQGRSQPQQGGNPGEELVEKDVAKIDVSSI